MLVWQGYGFLGAVIPLVMFVLAGMLNAGQTQATNMMMAGIFFVSAVLVWVLGTKLNSKPGKVLIDPDTQEEVELKTKHTLFWIPMEWVAIAWALMAVYSLMH